jgi:hypothetical protein
MYKRSVINQILVAFLFCSLASAVEKGGTIWTAFVLKPNASNYEICQMQINDSLSGKYKALHSPTYLQLLENDSVWKLLELIDRGNRYAAELCFQFYPLFYGHSELQEFFNIHLGRLIKTDPEFFLKSFKEYVYKNSKYTYDVNGLLGNYGDEFVDNPNKQLGETKKRIESLERIKKEHYMEVRDYCIGILRKRKN